MARNINFLQKNMLYMPLNMIMMLLLNFLYKFSSGQGSWHYIKNLLKKIRKKKKK